MSPEPRRSGGFSLEDYVTVAQRVEQFYARFPEGSLQSEIVELSESRVVVRGVAYRTADDPRPGVAHSMLAIPGSTPYTRGSEVENAETSAVGRAIAFLGFEVRKGIASQDEVRTKSGAPSAAERDGAGLTGTVEATDKTGSDLMLRQGADGSYLGFRLRGDRGGILVRCRGPLAEQLAGRGREALSGVRATCWGSISDESFTPRATPGRPDPRPVSYQVLDADRVSLPGGVVLPEAREAAPEPMFDAVEQAAIDAALGIVP